MNLTEPPIVETGYPPGKVGFLPYHATGENKYRALGLGEPEKFSAPSQEVIGKLKAAVKSL